MIPTFSRREIEDLEPSIRSYSSETLIIDPFYLYRMYTTDLFGPLPELESNYRQERSFITNRSLLTFPRQVPIRVTIFVPAPRELYTGKLPGYNNVNGVCLSGNDSELFVYWGVWDMTLDDTFQVTKEQLKLMPRWCVADVEINRLRMTDFIFAYEYRSVAQSSRFLCFMDLMTR
ncbi:hypothetical protein BT96DRAFT_251254 [Gymnopus androsaceus JB14]|uniref:Uncharacterized protein n=1 Tax=Gymnopus androsaceus JB14 TaxID=1447944 RepID=A0A6A4I6P0_9AGAR|nr:hypothetical protein BT96DRAFT_251254 [Gymnopus androsaceus JB14]